VSQSIEPYVRSPKGGAPEGDDPRRCTATSKNTGERCARWAMEGQNVCPFHGGKTPLARRKAQLVLLDLVGPATSKLEKILKETTDERVALKAVEMIYDRTGLEAKTGGVDSQLAKELLVSRLLQARGEKGGLAPEEEEGEVFDAEIIEDGEPTLEDLI
jgi:hypothetical protein